MKVYEICFFKSISGYFRQSIFLAESNLSASDYQEIVFSS